MSKRSKMPSGYGIVQSAVMKMQGLSKEAKALYALLASYTGASDYCWPSIETQSNDLQCSKASIKRYQSELVKLELLQKSKKWPGTLSNLNQYEIMLIDEPTNRSQVSPSRVHTRAIAGVTHDPQNINNKNSSKKVNIKESARKNGHRFDLRESVIKLFDTGFLKLESFAISWEGNGAKYGQAVKRIIKSASKEADTPQGQFDHIRARATVLYHRLQGQVFVKGEPRFLPTTLSMNWNDLTPPKKPKQVAEISDAEYQEQLKELDF